MTTIVTFGTMGIAFMCGALYFGRNMVVLELGYALIASMLFIAVGVMGQQREQALAIAAACPRMAPDVSKVTCMIAATAIFKGDSVISSTIGQIPASGASLNIR